MAPRSPRQRGIVDWLHVPLASLSKVKLPGGVVGKLSMVLIATAFGAAGIAWSSPGQLVAMTAIICVSGVVLIVGLRLIAFAEKHPQTALTECRGKIALCLRVIDANEERDPVITAEGEAEAGDPLAVLELDFMVGGLVFPEPGEYRVQLFADRTLIIERRLVVTLPPARRPEPESNDE